MRIENVPLFTERKEIYIALAVWGLLFSLHLAWLYRGWMDFVDRPFLYEWGSVLQAHSGKGGAKNSSTILKIRDDAGRDFYVWGPRNEFLQPGQRVRLQLFPEKVGFLDYLRGPYLPARIKAVRPRPPGLLGTLQRFVAAQHRQKESAAFYEAIFFATPLDRNLREKIAALGASPLVALSGLHLSILWGGLFLLLSPLYRLLQARYFPWRYELLDLGSFTLLLLAGYLWLTGPPPSLLRSYLMLLLGWGALLLGIELLSFTFLAVVAALLLLFDPRLALSWGFWLSLAGVFYIYLLLRYWGRRSRWLFAGLVLPVGIFLLMLPIVHSLFPLVSPWQWLSPLLSLLFTLFYPLAILLHLAGAGGILDGALGWLWSLPSAPEARTLPHWTLAAYLPLSLLAIRYRWAFVAVGLFALVSAARLYL
ncbi:ComEC/Rec2 family competence protein [Nitratifractor sp.]|uniref:ComEC/Rec2 family competence protein n=1 Tax=Nitratifractor sp. TaxID=2268144 RepID=UPI0025DCCD9B|nr:ComEC/Rec2 family competence protein [Nitratifractor sp.]